jgi:hypothetical protein
MVQERQIDTQRYQHYNIIKLLKSSVNIGIKLMVFTRAFAYGPIFRSIGIEGAGDLPQRKVFKVMKNDDNTLLSIKAYRSIHSLREPCHGSSFLFSPIEALR